MAPRSIETHRRLLCRGCGNTLFLCYRCDRRQRYCGPCARSQRRVRGRLAEQRYRLSPAGKLNNARRQSRWRRSQRFCAFERVVTHPSPLNEALTGQQEAAAPPVVAEPPQPETPIESPVHETSVATAIPSPSPATPTLALLPYPTDRCSLCQCPISGFAVTRRPARASYTPRRRRRARPRIYPRRRE